MDLSPGGSSEVLSPIARTAYVPVRVEGVPVEPASAADVEIDPRERQSWEGLAQHPPWSWEPYQGFGYLERWVREADDALDDAVGARSKPLGIDEVAEFFGDIGRQELSIVEVVILTVLAHWMFGSQRMTFGRSWREDYGPRSAFGRIEEVFEFLSGDRALGIGTGQQWTRGADGEACLQIADDRDEDVRERARARARGRALPQKADGTRSRGFLPVAYLSAKQSRSGSLGGTKGLAQVELEADVERALAAAGLDRAAVRYLEAFYGAGEKRDDESPQDRAHRRTASRAAIAARYRTWNRVALEDLSDEAFGELMKRQKKALETALRRATPDPVSRADGQLHDSTERTLLRLAPAKRAGDEGPSVAPARVAPIEAAEPIGLAS